MSERARSYSVGYADWTASEFGAMARCLLTGRVNQGPDIARLQERLQAVYASSRVHLLNYAHHGIGLALSMFQRERPGRKEVIVPSYICPSVPQTVRSAGLRVRCVPVGIDLNLTVEGVRNAISSDTLAVIAPHMYGCPAPIEALESLCQATGVYLIDDAAQVVGVRSGGRLLGTFGDVGVISFAQSKAIVTGIRGSGGVLLVNRTEWHEQAASDCSQLPAASGRLGALTDFLWNYVGATHTGRSGYYFARLRNRLNWMARSSEGPTRISNLEAAVALVQLSRWEEIRQKRIRLTQAYSDTLAMVEGLSFPQFQPNRFLARVVLRLPPGVSATALRKRLDLDGVESRSAYPPLVEALESKMGGPNWSESLIGLPVASCLSESDVRAINSVLAAAIVEFTPKT